MFDKYFQKSYTITENLFNEKLFKQMRAAVRELKLDKYIPRVETDKKLREQKEVLQGYFLQKELEI